MKMTNAEKLAKKLAKNTEFMVRIIDIYCNSTACNSCPMKCTDACPYATCSGMRGSVATWLESEAKEEEFAIWKYDNFPYMKIGKVKYKNADGTVEIYGYDGMCFKPMKIMAYDEAVISKFNAILEAHRKAEKEADKRTLCNLRTLLGFQSEVEDD